MGPWVIVWSLTRASTMKRWLNILSACVLLVLVSQTWAQPTSAQEAQANDKIPPAKSKFMGRRIAQAMSFHGANWLIRSEREQEERPTQVLENLGLKPGMTVCDMGCGNGFYALEIAKLVAPAMSWRSISNRKCSTCSSYVAMK